MLVNNRIEEPYDKRPGEGPLPILSRSFVKSKLTSKFWNKMKYITNINTNTIMNPKSNSMVNNNNKLQYKKKRRGKTPSIKHVNSRYINENKKDVYYYYNEDNMYNSNIYNKNNILEKLRVNAIKLEEELNENELIIEQQKEENSQLLNRIDNLKKYLQSLISKDKI